ncbi:hypothetical protein EPO04_03600 [Patescibacteria group bacterium]|nr:MAG: hypothetical protein EPO04_03600 [Patescibacteria group bacterium]
MTEILYAVIGLQILLTGLVVVVLWRARRPVKPAAKPAVSAASEAELRQQIEAQQQAMLKRLQEETQSSFEQSVSESSKLFRSDLAETSKKLNTLIVRLTTEVVERELDEYRQSLVAARQQALTSLQQMQQSVEEKQRALEADVNSELAKRQQYLLERLDQRLGQAVTSYLVEALGQGADLGAQREYLLAQLEAHKDELKKEVKQ